MKRPNWSNKWIQVCIHILVWSVIFSLPYLIDISHAHHIHPPHNLNQEAEFLKLNLYSYFFWVISFYLNTYFLMPRFFNRKKYGYYVLSLILTFALVLALHSLLFRFLITGEPFDFVGSLRFNFPAFLLTIAVSIAFKLIVDKQRSEKLQMEKQQENMKTELAFLRSQISPHFLMNVLNNIVALNRLKSDELEPTLMKLSGLMQYMLYETDEEKVPLKTEAEYLTSYIELQQQRFGSKVKINLQISLASEWSEIEPMLLIPFVENAFKHGIGMIENPEIDIDLKTNKQNELFFQIRNKYNTASTQIKDKTSGIGLNNVQRRLNILYNNNYKLTITREADHFKVFLTIKLH
ncbi:MAG: histidine kinase [Bacteroidota bacterium]|nr:histidine kinase [Bacteroidota bacterium]